MVIGELPRPARERRGPGAVIGRRRARLITIAALSLVVAVLFGWTARLSWVANTTEARHVDSERMGTAYLRPLNHLLSGMTAAQSAAVRGVTVDDVAVLESVDAVEAVDRTVGAALQSRKRWVDLRGQIDHVLASPTTGRGAYDAFTPVVGLCLDLIRQVGETSTLVLDPEVDSYFLIDAALRRLPEAMVYAGRAADLAALTTAGTSGAADTTEVAVARHRVAAAAADAATGLGRSVGSTARDSLGPAITSQLDAFRAAVDGLVPPIVLRGLAVPVDRGRLVTAAEDVRAAATALATVVLAELDALLVDRQGRLSSQRRAMAGAAVAAVVASLLLAWVLGSAGASARSRADQDDQDDEVGERVEVSPGEYADTLVPRDLIDARELDFEELVHVGRAVRSRWRERADDDPA
jgi:hypothetical protein